MMGARPILAAAAALGLTVASASGSAQAQAQASVEARGSVTIVDPPSVGQGAEILVRPVARPGAVGVTARTVGGRFEVGGAAGDSYNLATPSSLKLMRADGAGEVLMKLAPGTGVSRLPGAVGARSTSSVVVEGAVGIEPGAAAGVYKGSLPVILALP